MQFGQARSIVPSVVDARTTKIPVRRVTQASDFSALDCATILHFVVLSGTEPARALSAEFESYLLDRAEKLHDASASERRASDERAFAFVRRLEELGCVVCAGFAQAELRFDDDPSKTRSFHIGCIAVSNQADEAEFVSV